MKKSHRKKRKQIIEKTIAGNYILQEIFEDFYEHEVYFKLINKIEISGLCPSDIEVQLSSKVKRPRLNFPDEYPKLMRIIIPVTKAQDNLKKNRKLLLRASTSMPTWYLK